MATAMVNGTELYYQVRGDGPPLLTLHGGLGMDHIYMKASAGPVGTAHERHLLRPSGNGRSDHREAASLTMEQLADDAAALLEHLGHDSAIIFGHSYGGFIAQELVLRHPSRVRGLVLVDTTPGQLGATESPDEEQGPPIPDELVEAMSAVPTTDEQMATAMLTILPLYMHTKRADEVLPLVEGTVWSAAAQVRGFEILGSWSSVDRLATIAAPTLLLWGRHDAICSVPQARRIASRIPGAELRVFERSGHFPWVEEPDGCFAALEEWLHENKLA